MMSYRWWVPELRPRSKKPTLVRALTDLSYVSPWLYLVLPLVLLAFAVISPSMRSPLALAAVAVCSIAWVVATRARFALALNAERRRIARLRVIEGGGSSARAA